MEKEIQETNVTEETNQEEKTFVGSDGEKYTQKEWENPVIVGGPTRGTVEEWKKEHGSLYYYPHDSGVYIFRALKRDEYRELKEKDLENMEINDDFDMAFKSENLLTKKCVLFPYDYADKVEEDIPAGLPSSLAEMIYQKSGFAQVAAPIKL